MENDNRSDRLNELNQLRRRVTQIEHELRDVGLPEQWEAKGYYFFYHATTGFFLGILGALASLFFNIIGSLIVGQHPLRIIQVYLTFPLGEQAMSVDFNSGLALAVGCCLYMGTGMVLGIPFQLIIARTIPNATLGPRLMLATIMGLALWIISYYGVLSWLQPLLFDGNWIVDQVPMAVAALTHLMFAWTMALVYPLGMYIPYRSRTGAS